MSIKWHFVFLKDGNLENSNTFDIIVDGVDLLLDASNHESMMAVIPRDVRITDKSAVQERVF